METVLNLIKMMVAVVIVLGLMFFGFIVLLGLLAIAAVAGGIIWLRQKGVMKSSSGRYSRREATEKGFATEEHQRITIIEGEVEEIAEQNLKKPFSH